MKKILNLTDKLAKYFIVFILVMFALLGILILVASIPNKYIKINLDKSVIYLNKKRDHEFKYKSYYKFYSWLHVYADEMVLNIIYNLDKNDPLRSVMKAEYTDIENYNYLNRDDKLSEGISKFTINEPHRQYIRYWHGSMIILIPLLIFLNIHQIYIIFAIVLGILIAILITMLWKRKQFTLIIRICSCKHNDCNHICTILC